MSGLIEVVDRVEEELVSHPVPSFFLVENKFNTFIL